MSDAYGVNTSTMSETDSIAERPPPITYQRPSTTAEASPCRFVGRSGPRDQVNVARSSEAANALASYTGLPTIIVPGGFFSSDGMPFAVQFLGKPFAEPTLIKLASVEIGESSR